MIVNGANVSVGASKLGCDQVNVIDIVDGAPAQTGAATIDLRGVKGPAFSHLSRTTIIANGFDGNTIYGSEFNDAVFSYATVAINTRGGDDSINFGAGRAAPGPVVHGGAGNDQIFGEATFATAYGDAGNDSFASGQFGSSQDWIGGPGNDTFALGDAYIGARSVSGGGGDDAINLARVPTGATAVNMGLGNDTINCGCINPRVTNPNPADVSLIRVFTGSTDLRIRNSERLVLGAGEVGPYPVDIVMQPLTKIDLVRPVDSSAVIRVPAATWQLTASGITAVGLQPITWTSGTPTVVKFP